MPVPSGAAATPAGLPPRSQAQPPASAHLDQVCRRFVDHSIGTVTALNPVIGYERATELAAEAMRTGRGILELLREQRILTEAEIAAVLDPVAMTGQGRVA